VLAIAAAIWTAFWYRAAQVAEATISDWIEREAAAGRVYTCLSRSTGGYPFRIEHRCSEPAAQLQGFGAPIVLKARAMVGVAQVYQPRLIIAELTAPLTISESGRDIGLADWRLAQASLRGSPGRPERISLVIDGARVDQPSSSGAATLLVADRVEFHARVAPSSSAQAPAIDFALRVAAAAAPGINFLTKPANAEVTATLTGLADLQPKPLAVRLKELQAAGARLAITQARIERDRTVSLATGDLGLSAAGRLDGAVTLTVAGLENLGLALGGGELGLSLLGKPAELEGKRAIALPLRLKDGAVFLGPVRLGRLPALY
jgi:hypothetical protein